jgi:predicted phage terminase large subunit-like protein
MSTLRLEMPAKIAECLSVPSRYKVLYGGRGSGKSWGVARYLLAMGIQKPLRILCARETQKSIADSVHKLLADQIRAMGIEAHYEVQKATIKGKNGTEFLFSGLRDAASLKSYESINICWVEEAQAVSEESWQFLVPTIRAPESEIWVVFNPLHEQDPTYQRFVIDPPSSDCRVLKVNYCDNPWFPDVLKAEMLEMRERAYNHYLHVWEGECVIAPEGAVYNLDWFPRYAQLPAANAVKQIIHSWDTAYKAGTHNDPSCCLVFHVTDSHYFLAEVIHGKWEYPELKRRAFELAARDKPHAILIEDKASGQSLIQEFRAATTQPVIAMKPNGDKETRARVSSDAAKAGRVMLPERAPWLSTFETELMLFPSDKSYVHDDQVDAFSQFLEHMRQGNGEDFDAIMDRLYPR